MSEVKIYHKNVKTGGSDIWGTPPDLFEILDREFGFTIDVCAESHNAKCDRYFSPQDNGLDQDWIGEVCFMNPPYSEIKAWVIKAYIEAQRGALIVGLLPARVGTSWWVKYVSSAEVWFLPGRLRFIEPEGTPAKYTAGFPSAIAIFGRDRGPSTNYWDYRKEDPSAEKIRYFGSKRGI